VGRRLPALFVDPRKLVATVVAALEARRDRLVVA
jgi:hypothetical protein